MVKANTSLSLLPAALKIARLAEGIETIRMWQNVDDDLKPLFDDCHTRKMNMAKSLGANCSESGRSLQPASPPATI